MGRGFRADSTFLHRGEGAMSDRADTPDSRPRQPKALYLLFMTEMWERFGFFVMATLFVLYLTDDLKLSDDAAFLTFGAYMSLAYLTTVAGGVLADRLLGFRTCIVLGASLMSAGYILLPWGSEFLMYLSLGILVVGNGFFKPNVASLLGTFYGPDDPRRDSGFTIFYFGINLGAFAASLIAGFVAVNLGYPVAFAMAGVGKLISLSTFVLGRLLLEDHGHAPAGSPLAPGGAGKRRIVVSFVAGILGTVGLAAFLVKHGLLAGEILAGAGLLVTGCFIYEIFREEREERRKLFAMLVLILFAVVFFSVYMQSGSSVTLFVERAVDLDVVGMKIPPSDAQSLNPFFILLLAPIFSLVWARLEGIGRDPSIPFKFMLGLAFIGAAFFLMRLGAATAGQGHQVPFAWIVLFFLVYTMGEMSLSPLGLSMVSALAPRRLAGFAMGIWMLSISAANYLSGIVAKVAAVPAGALAAREREIYETGFSYFGVLAVSAALLLFALLPLLRRMMRPRAPAAEPPVTRRP
jgi:POT family proton-dependent oligopeptide transporter